MSLIFLMSWNWQSAVVATLNAAWIFTFGRLIEETKSVRTKKIFTITAISSQVLLLLLTRFFTPVQIKQNYETTLLTAAVFIGVAYYVLQNISYIVEVHTNRIKAERNYLYYFSYIIYFPKIMLGPIERYDRFKEQLTKEPIIKLSSRSLYLISLGLFKKLVISARIMSFYNEMQSSYSGSHPIIIYWTVAVLGLFVFYADFSAYMNIGQGVSLLFGIELTENFNQPYLSRSPLDYWQRWHISLTNWMRDYIYYPLMLLSKNIYFAIFATFILVGLWHGLTKELMIFGIAWGFFQTAYIFLKKNVKILNLVPPSMRTILGIFLTFTISVLIGLYTYFQLFFKPEVLNTTQWIDAHGIFLYQKNFQLFIFIVLMIILESANKKTKSTSFYLNASVLLIFLTAAFMLSKSYLFYYMRL